MRNISTMAFDVEPMVRREHDGYIMAMMRAVHIMPGVSDMNITITEAEAIRALRAEVIEANLNETRTRRLMIEAQNMDRPLYTRQLRAKQHRKAVLAYKVLSRKLAMMVAAARG